MVMNTQMPQNLTTLAALRTSGVGSSESSDFIPEFKKKSPQALLTRPLCSLHSVWPRGTVPNLSFLCDGPLEPLKFLTHLSLLSQIIVYIRSSVCFLFVFILNIALRDFLMDRASVLLGMRLPRLCVVRYRREGREESSPSLPLA